MSQKSQALGTETMGGLDLHIDPAQGHILFPLYSDRGGHFHMRAADFTQAKRWRESTEWQWQQESRHGSAAARLSFWLDEDEYGAFVGLYWQGEPEVLWGKPVALPLIHHKSHVDSPGPPQWEARVWPPVYCDRNCLLDSQNNVNFMFHYLVTQTARPQPAHEDRRRARPQTNLLLVGSTAAGPSHSCSVVLLPVGGQPNRNVTTNVEAVRSFKTSGSIEWRSPGKHAKDAFFCLGCVVFISSTIFDCHVWVMVGANWQYLLVDTSTQR